ncbi:Transposase, Mutator family [Actinoalloteichus hymeniacidonis]|uniref:Mutator family transposase n=1 Tax=Actinoalloteichus hymeniacidonis TaxID=340345 RepID=A0AAC9HU53_9PSEU|nr:Transposase, Mutator family [Actinoalloteichus hymeniacidonis]
MHAVSPADERLRRPAHGRAYRRTGCAVHRLHRHALDAARAFEAAYGAKFPKATAKITDDIKALLAVYDLPAEHWTQLRTTNSIESIFTTVRHRTKNTRQIGAAPPQSAVFAAPYLATIVSTASSTTWAIEASSGDQSMSSIRGQRT